MSENVLKLIPVLPDFVPGDAELQRTCERTALLFHGAGEVSCEVAEHVRFVDQGQNWERVLCPVCASELDDRWWQHAMNTAHQTRFEDLSVVLPCCCEASSLSDLVYEWPAGFARFTIQVRSPGRDIDDQQLEDLGKSLGCELRKIWARY